MTVNNPGEVPQHDIEMLEIPDDSSISSDELETSGLKNRLKLQDWLETLQRMEFNFDHKQYEESLTQADDFSKTYTNYVTSLYKVIEKLLEENVGGLPNDIDDNEPLGVVVGRQGTKINSSTVHRNNVIDRAFADVVDILQVFIDKIDENHEDITLFYRISNILDCLQAIHFLSLGQQVPELVSKWINKYEMKPENELVESIMLKTRTPYSHPQFWNTYLAQLLTRGLVQQAFEALSNSGYEELKESQLQVYDLIKDFATLLGSDSSMALKGQFAQWKLSSCETRDLAPRVKEDVEDSSLRQTVSQIYDLLCIITGLPKTIASYCDSWYEIFTALAFFQVRDSALFRDYFDIATNEKPPPAVDVSEGYDELDIDLLTEQCFVDIMEESFVKVLTTIDKLDLATAAYVSRLLEVKGLLKSYYDFDVKQSVNDYMTQRTISEYLLTTQAYQCLNTHDLVPVGIGLLLNEDIASSSLSIVHNRRTIESFLPLYHYQTNDDLEWGLTICATLNLVHTAKELYYTYGMNSLKEGYIYEGLNMLANCYDQQSTSDTSVKSMREIHRVVWDIIFHEAVVSSQLFDDDLINNVVLKQTAPDFDIHPVIRQCLSPYAVFAEFLLAQKEQKTTGVSRLIHLLRFQHLPKKFCVVLFCQFLGSILECDAQLPEMIMFVELIDNYYTLASKEEKAESEELYHEALAMPQVDAKEQWDWRRPVKKLGKPIPSNGDDAIKLLRNVISTKIAELYIK